MFDTSYTYFSGCGNTWRYTKGFKLWIDSIEIFPADIYGGLKALQAFQGPFPEVSFLPTGGINLDNFSDYLACSNVFAVGGSEGTLKTENGIHAQKQLEEIARRMS